jgi:hypothetical protein
MNCVPQLSKREVVVSDSPVPVVKIDTACKLFVDKYEKIHTHMLTINMILV